jgi:hypothetical protein
MGRVIIDRWLVFLQSLHYIFSFTLLVGLGFGVRALFVSAPLKINRIRVIVAATALSYLGSFILSWTIYPFFRPELRANVLSMEVPRAIGIFLIKEHISAIGALIAIALLVMTIFGHMNHASMARWKLYGSMFATLGLITILMIASAFLLNGMR